MPNALLAFVAFVLIVVAYRLGVKRAARPSIRFEAYRGTSEPGFSEYFRLERRRLDFARAAQAVGMWQYRIDRRAALMRHLESLADAPELGAATPNPEPASGVEASSASPVSSAAPVLERPIVPENRDDSVESYRMEGIL